MTKKTKIKKCAKYLRKNCGVSFGEAFKIARLIIGYWGDFSPRADYDFRLLGCEEALLEQEGYWHDVEYVVLHKVCKVTTPWGYDFTYKYDA